MHDDCGNTGLQILAVVAVVCAGVSLLCWDGWVSTGTRPHQVKAKRENTPEDGFDRISELPDDVIFSIISRLHTRAAVRTSLLSRRWRHAYTLIHQVQFFCCNKYDGYTCYPTRISGEELSQLQMKFVQGVDTFLQHHSGSKIMSFELICCFSGCISDKFREWMNAVGTLGVEQLTVGFCSLRYLLRGSGLPVFSTDFLTEASSVRHLWLRGGSFLIPNKNYLQVLQLDDIALTPEAIQCILSNCVSLQSMNLKNCVLPSKLLIHGPDLKLRSLMILHGKNINEIDLSAINLVNFEIYNRSTVGLSFSHVPSLQTLFIGFHYGGVYPCVLEKIAKDLPHLESMVFMNNASFFEGWKLDRVTSKLSNLRHLVLILESPNKLDLLRLAVFLDACPLLHKFHLSMVHSSTFNLKQAPERMIRRNTRLKEVEFNGFRGEKSEYNFILYILKTVASLERLILTRCYSVYDICSRRWMVSTCSLGNYERRIIRKRLQGQAISKYIEIITI